MALRNFHSLLSEMLAKSSDNLLIQLFRYTIVGGLSFLVDYALLIFLTEIAGFNIIVSATVSFIAGLSVNYYISTRWVFHNSNISDKRLEFLIYALVGVAGLVLNDLALYLFTDFIEIHYAIAKPLTATIVYGWNFFARRYIIFNSNNTTDEEENCSDSRGRTGRTDCSI